MGQKTKLIHCPIAKILSTHDHDSTADTVLVMPARLPLSCNIGPFIMQHWSLDHAGAQT